MRLSVAAADSDKFLMRGNASFKKVLAAFRNADSEGVEGKRILEWGCGCGRMTRHALEAGYDVWGVDINADAVAWMKENLSPHRFQQCDILPPLAFPDASFDCIYGGSVITHLSVDLQFRWITELRRVLKPGGLLLLTFAGTYHFRNYFGRDRLTVGAINTEPFLEVGTREEGSNSYGIAQTIGSLCAIAPGFLLAYHVQADDILGAQDTAVFIKRVPPEPETYFLLRCSRFIPSSTPAIGRAGAVLAKVNGGIPDQLHVVSIPGTITDHDVEVLAPLQLVESVTISQ